MNDEDMKSMEEVFIDEISDRMQGAYTNLFLLALKKQLNLKTIVETATREVETYIGSLDEFVPTGMNGLLFLSAVAQMMDCSLFDILYLSDQEKERIICRMIDDIDVDEIYDFDLSEGDSYFVYDYIFDDEYGRAVDYELTFIDVDDECRIRVNFFFQRQEGFVTDYMYDSVDLWVGSEGNIYDFIQEALEELEEDEEEPIDFKDFFIHAARKECSHEYIKVKATVPIYANWTVTSITFEAEYCAECGVYFIPENVYQTQIKPKGRLLCQVMSAEEYRSFKKMKWNDIDLNPQSILNILGYNVNLKEDLSDHQRQTILRYAIESGIITKKKTISYLEIFIKKNGAKSGMENAVRKWKKDLQWVMDYDGKGDIIIGVKRVIVD